MNIRHQILFIITLYFILLLSTVVYSNDIIHLTRLNEISESACIIINIDDQIDNRIQFFIERLKKEINKNNNNINLLILNINTPGGRVDSVLKIINDISDINKNVKIISYVEDIAWSAGALIAMAGETIYMKTGASIGSATPVSISGGNVKVMSEKFISAIRSKFKAQAQKMNYNELIAIAMVDKDYHLVLVEKDDEKIIMTYTDYDNEKDKYKLIKTITNKGKLLNLTAQDALDIGFISAIKQNIYECTDSYKEYFVNIYTVKPNWSEKLVLFLLSPGVTSLLMIAGFLAVWIEIKSPGFGVPGIIGILCFLLLFSSKYLAGLAENWQILLFIVGIILIIIELFVIPGFGIVGILGIIVVFISLLLSMQHFVVPETPWDYNTFKENISLLILNFAIIITLGIIMMRYLPSLPLFNRLILNDSETLEEGYTTDVLIPENDNIAIVTKDLRPTGKIKLNNKIYDAVSENEYIGINTKVKILKKEYNSYVVTAVTSEDTENT